MAAAAPQGSIVVACVEPSLAYQVWDRVKDMIDMGYAAGDDFMPDDMLERIRYGRILLWAAIEEDGNILAAMTTELVPMRSGLVCWMCQCGGAGMPLWARFHTQIEEYAKTEQCVKVCLRGREGWQRILSGYRVRTVQMEKLL
jgi:hypothetical protein